MSDVCSLCKKEIHGDFLFADGELPDGTYVQVVVPSLDQDWICCDRCNAAVCRSCAPHWMSGYCESCAGEFAPASIRERKDAYFRQIIQLYATYHYLITKGRKSP